MIFCSLCGLSLGWGIGLSACSACEASLDIWQDLTVRSVAGLPLLSLWQYRGCVRDAILAFKVQKNWCAGAYLVETMLAQEEVQAWVSSLSAVMAMPSSVWGRIRGRYDLAALAAGALSLSLGLRRVVAPWRLQGRWSKQALISRHERIQNPIPVRRSRWDAAYFSSAQGRKAEKRPCILLVDDIVTTGQSLRSFKSHFEGVDFRVLTLATALRVEASL